MTDKILHIIGGGMAGSEAAWAAAQAGVKVVIHEMRPVRTTPAHQTDRLAELVCSNTFKSTETGNAHGQHLIFICGYRCKSAHEIARRQVLPRLSALDLVIRSRVAAFDAESRELAGDLEQWAHTLSE